MRIALIGDLHFGKLSVTNEFSIVGEALEDVTNGGVPLRAGFEELIKDKELEFLFVAGDLTSSGSPIEYSKCIEMLYSMATTAGISNENVILSVGNHDVDRQISKIPDEIKKIQGATYPIKEVEQFYQRIAASHGQYHATHLRFTVPGPVPFSGVLEKENVIIFTLNSGWLCSHQQEHKHGKLESAQLQWFREKATTYEADSRWKIVLLHHHPFSYPHPNPSRDVSILEEGADFVEIAGSMGINLVCHGHRHHPKAYNESRDGWKNPVTFLCAGSFSVNARHRSSGAIPNVFHVLELLEEASKKTVIVHSYQYSICDGWVPIANNCSETPIDHIMVFERYYGTDEVKSILQGLLPSTEPFLLLPSWDSLPIALRTLRFKRLDEIIHEVANKEFKIVGKYPGDVALVRRDVKK